ncbi:glycosyltransferase family A protein [Algoriphagus sp. C2-6-M1]|uniref:glycosyltransferase family 2 protein n=1 Tax=Algoriphagus persicinus TaxID=3108754 RepID=UPI002B37F54F|nr:glycosyltransferase family A protein [Algoriphagus sp. C2-6-M1]MEB2782424.1 glycosyltransferase family A protein [Algoriphagus sp. C2-6-M1]
MQDFPLVSVIIPVYQAVDFVESAVLSAIHLPEVGEVILIEDGSSDDSYTKCLELENIHRNVVLFIHEKRKNLGAAASRNVGILKANFPYIAFLDADDYFLSNRFDFFMKFKGECIQFDGIYEAIQYFNGYKQLYTINKSNINPKDLSHYLIRGTYGHFHTNGLIVKKELLIKSGLFINSLDLHEDSDLWIKLAYYGKLIPGNLADPVSKVRRHDGNRIWKGTTNTSRLKQWKVTWDWAKNERIGIINKLLIIRKLINYTLGSLKE